MRTIPELLQLSAPIRAWCNDNCTCASHVQTAYSLVEAFRQNGLQAQVQTEFRAFVQAQPTFVELLERLAAQYDWRVANLEVEVIELVDSARQPALLERRGVPAYPRFASYSERMSEQDRQSLGGGQHLIRALRNRVHAIAQRATVFGPGVHVVLLTTCMNVHQEPETLDWVAVVRCAFIAWVRDADGVVKVHEYVDGVWN